MKRILSLFLSFVLVLSMVSGTIITEASGTEPTKLVKAMDTTGRNYTDYKSELTTVWNNQYMSMVECPSDAQAASLLFTRTGKTTRWEIYPMEGGSVETGEHTVSFKFFADKGKYDVSSDGTLDLALDSIVINRGSGVHTTTDFTISSLKPAKWYELKFHFDLNASPATVTFTAKNIETGILEINKTINPTWNPVFKNIYMRTHYTPNTGGNMFVKDFCIISNYGDTKASITSVGSDGSAVIPHSQNKVKFTLDRELPGLTAEHVFVKNSQGAENKATQITVTSDATAPGDAQWNVEATLEQDLTAWTNYNVAISKDYYAGYKEVSGTSYVPVTDIAKEFSTPSAPLDIRAPQFSNDGSATTDIISTIGNTHMTFVYTNTASSGYIKEVKSKDFSVNGTMNGASISFNNGFANGDTAKLFVIKGWTNPVPLFNKTWAQSYDGTIPEADEAIATSDASSGQMTFGDFDYSAKKMTINLNVGSDAGSTDGVLYIYKRGTTLKDNLIYADYVTTSSNGSLAKEITFAPDVDDVTGEYTAAFYADGIVIKNDFPIYDATAANGGNIAQATIDTTGRNYDDFYTELGTVWTNSYMGYEKGSEDPTTFNLTYNRADHNMRFVLTPGGKDGTAGIHTVRFKLYGEKEKADGTIDFNDSHIVVNRRDGHTSGDFTLASLKACTWYDISIVFDTESTPKTATITAKNLATDEVEYTDYVSTAVGGDNFEGKFTNMWMHLNYIAGTTEQMLVKDLQVIADYSESKSAVRYIGNDGIVNYGQKEIEFKISENNDITKDNVYVKDSQGNIIKAKSITVTEDMGEYIITAVMEKDLASWQTYTLMVDALGYENYRELVDGKYVAVTPISRAFTTPVAPLDIEVPTITSDGSSVTFEAVVSNSTSKGVDATTILTVVGSDGIMNSVSADYNRVDKNDDMSFINTNDFSEGDTAKYFVIESFDNPVQLFDKTWSVNYDGTIPVSSASKETSKAGNNAIVLDKYDFETEFDHEGKKLGLNLNTGKNAPVDGVLYVYAGDAISADNLPVFADYITTASGGTYAKEIKFDSGITDATKEYTVAFYSKDLDGVIKSNFNVYNKADLLEYKRNNIFERAQKASTFSGLMQIITGTDENGNTMDEAWEIFSDDADVSVYEKLSDKQKVYIELINSVKSISDYDALCDKFEEIALAQSKKTSGGSSSSTPSSNNKNTGGSSVSMSATPSKPANDNASISGGAVFADMTGHWAQKHVEALAKRGIVNGYNDGTFRGNNSISRAELAKIIVEAFEISGASDNSFTDVNASSWYYSYVSRAAAAGIVNGTGNGSFAPDNNVSRQDAVLMIYRAMNLKNQLPAGYKFFADEKDIQDYASDAIRCLGDLGIITGSEDSRFLPLNAITRAEMAAVICRSLDYLESHLQ